MCFRPLSEAETNGYVPISGANQGKDIEKGEDVRERSWYALIGTALKHIWPRTFATQSRVVICVIIVILQRLVNLAVPILCESLFTSILPAQISLLLMRSDLKWSKNSQQ